MAYSHKNSRGQTYYLHTVDVTLFGGMKMSMYYFSREVKPKYALDAMPAGRKVIENKKSGLPLLKRA